VNRVAGVASSAAIGIVLSPTSATEDVVVVAELHDADGDFDALAARIVAEVRSALGFAPGRVLLVPIGTVPLTSAGKVQYEKLRRMVATDALADRLFVGS
jgi:acyl-CoA synthetase (AMP-forming)/AMP-acid ligase II